MSIGSTTDLLSDFAQNNVDWLRRTTTKRRASLSVEEWSQFAIVCEFLAGLAVKYRDLVHTLLERGIESATLKERLESSTTFIDDAVQVMSDLQRTSESVSPDLQADLNRIRNASAVTEGVLADLVSLLALTEAEPQPVSEDVLTAAEAGTFIGLNEFRKRR